MRAISVTAAAIALMGTQADYVLAGGSMRAPSHGAPVQQAQVPQRLSGHAARQPAPQEVRAARNGVHPQYGGPRFEQRPDPNHQNLYRPMYSLDATNPGETHPYFQTRKDGFGYPAARPGAVYQGNGVYIIPR